MVQSVSGNISRNDYRIATTLRTEFSTSKDLPEQWKNKMEFAVSTSNATKSTSSLLLMYLPNKVSPRTQPA